MCHLSHNHFDKLGYHLGFHQFTKTKLELLGVEDVSAKGLRSQQVRAWALVLTAIVASASMRVVAMASLLPLITVRTPVGI